MHFLACRGGGGIQHGESWNTLHRSQDGYELLGSRAMLGAVFTLRSLCVKDTIAKDNTTPSKSPKWLKILLFVKHISLKALKHTFLYFANRLEFGLEVHKTLNIFAIGLVWLEWWFYFEGFWAYVWPYIIQFFVVLFLFLKLQIIQLFT